MNTHTEADDLALLEREMARLDAMTCHGGQECRCLRVIMCGCKDWDTCEHPWPQIFHLRVKEAP